MPIDRGDIFDAEIHEAGSHPVIVVTRQAAIPLRTNVTTVLVTSMARGHRAEVALDDRHGLDRDCVANCDEIHTLRKVDLIRKRGSLDLERMTEIDQALSISLGLS